MSAFKIDEIIVVIFKCIIVEVSILVNVVGPLGLQYLHICVAGSLIQWRKMLVEALFL